jgi:hypothetical protein
LRLATDKPRSPLILTSQPEHTLGTPPSQPNTLCTAR